MPETKSTDSEEPVAGIADNLVREKSPILVDDDEEAIWKATSGDFRIIVLDLKLPGIFGTECLKRLRSEGCGADMVMVTGYGNVPTAVEARKMGTRTSSRSPSCPTTSCR